MVEYHLSYATFLKLKMYILINTRSQLSYVPQEFKIQCKENPFIYNRAKLQKSLPLIKHQEIESVDNLRRNVISNFLLHEKQ